MVDCLFCAIIQGTVPAKKVYEDEFAFAFLDINPWQVGHTLVIPKRHVEDFLSDAALAEVAPAVAHVGRLLKDKLAAEGCNVLANCGAVAGQEVFHAHAHLIPRYASSPGIGNMRGEVSTDLDVLLGRIVG